MGSFAELIAREIGHPKVLKEELNIAKTDRFSFYKIGPVLSISVSYEMIVLMPQSETVCTSDMECVFACNLNISVCNHVLYK